ncbi:MAG: hypothetical protein JWM27_360 [Gemmatimonadetes bacterium]|nr:hypothetical protein [Gemmatimonadota bacterium]
MSGGRCRPDGTVGVRSAPVLSMPRFGSQADEKSPARSAWEGAGLESFRGGASRSARALASACKRARPLPPGGRTGVATPHAHAERASGHRLACRSASEPRDRCCGQILAGLPTAVNPRPPSPAPPTGRSGEFGRSLIDGMRERRINRPVDGCSDAVSADAPGPSNRGNAASSPSGRSSLYALAAAAPRRKGSTISTTAPPRSGSRSKVRTPARSP